jgi:MoaA/NifB/PqqE/SkfB family radical SAM enzyme
VRATVGAARDLGLNSISFLAADTSPLAFNHEGNLSASAWRDINLGPDDLAALTEEIDGLIADYPLEFASGFIRENPEKLRRIVLHFRVELGHSVPVAPPCNAPWTSAVIEPDGAVRPCFFHPPFGNIKDRTLAEVLNSDNALEFRSGLDVSTNPICQRCVCSLFLYRGTEALPPA